MEMTRLGHSLIGFCAALTVCCGGGVSSAAELAGLRARFEAHLAQYEAECNRALDNWERGYSIKIENLAKTAQQSGDLEAWQEATREKERFAKERLIPKITPAGTSKTLRNTHQRARETVAGIIQSRMEKTVDLTDKYLLYLEGKKVERTRKGDFEEAAMIQAEIKRVADIPIVQRARDQMAVKAESPVEKVAQPEAPVAPKPPDTPEGVVWSEGLTPPPVAGHSFRKLPLSSTGRMRVAHKLSVCAEVASSTSTQRGEYGDRSSSASYVMRLGLRPSDMGRIIEAGAILVVDYYGKQAARRSAHIIPIQMKSVTVPLPLLDGSVWRFAQMPPVAVDRIVYRAFNNDYRMGAEFYGIVVTVFDAAGEMIHQSISAANLADTARTKPPEPKREIENERRWWGAGVES